MMTADIRNMFDMLPRTAVERASGRGIDKQTATWVVDDVSKGVVIGNGVNDDMANVGRQKGVGLGKLCGPLMARWVVCDIDSMTLELDRLGVWLGGGDQMILLDVTRTLPTCSRKRTP